MRGLSLFGPAVVAVAKMCGNVDDADAYLRVMRVRESIYGDRRLQQLGVVRKHAFRAHVTLSYVEGEPDGTARAKLKGAMLDATSELQLSEPLPLAIHRTVLREFDDLTAFREPRLSGTAIR